MERIKDNDSLPQINLALVFGEESNLSFYYRKLAGNINDSKTVKKLVDDLDLLGFSKVKLVMDRGFYSGDNINMLYKNHLKFLIGSKMSLKFVKKILKTSIKILAILRATIKNTTSIQEPSLQNGTILKIDQQREIS